MKQIVLKQYKMGDMILRNRIVMSSMSRQRCDSLDQSPTDLMKLYYSQRSTAGLIITEGLPISKESISSPNSSGLFTANQAQGWSNIVNQIHIDGGIICAQLWHCGRSTHSDIIGTLPLAPSPLKIRQINRTVNKKYEIPKELDQIGINEIIQQFKNSAEFARQAKFDFIQIHAGGGYLIESFLKQSSNQRNDKYGNSIENRCRLCLEIVDAISSVFNYDKIGLKISPISRMNDVYDDNPIQLYTYLLEQLQKRNLGFIEIRDDTYPENWLGFGYPSSKSEIPDVYQCFRPLFNNTIIGNGGFTPESAEIKLQNTQCNLVSFGRLFISNPDLVNRIENQQELAQWDESTFITTGSKGYTDYQKFKDQ